MRRRDPRPLSSALERTAARTRPASTLARVREVWPAVAGPRVAAEAEPVSEREGIITVACGSAVWAQELDLLSADLGKRLEEALGSGEGPPAIRRLRFVTRSPSGL